MCHCVTVQVLQLHTEHRGSNMQLLFVFLLGLAYTTLHTYNMQKHCFSFRCAACFCNNHGVDCDSNSGYCDAICADNTAGHYCQVCAPGFFGYALLCCVMYFTVICVILLLFARCCCLRVSLQKFCQSRWFLQSYALLFVLVQCSHCFAECSCNKHSFNCDPGTGSCWNCTGNTQGPQCNQCVSGTGGNPLNGSPCTGLRLFVFLV